MCRCENSRASGVAEQRGLPALAKRVDDSPVAFDHHVRQRARVQYARNRAADPPMTDEHDVAPSRRAPMLAGDLRMPVILAAHEPGLPVEPAVDGVDGGEEELIECYRKQRASDDVALALGREDPERDTERGKDEGKFADLSHPRGNGEGGSRRLAQ